MPLGRPGSRRCEDRIGVGAQEELSLGRAESLGVDAAFELLGGGIGSLNQIQEVASVRQEAGGEIVDLPLLLVQLPDDGDGLAGKRQLSERPQETAGEK